MKHLVACEKNSELFFSTLTFITLHTELTQNYCAFFLFLYQLVVLAYDMVTLILLAIYC